MFASISNLTAGTTKIFKKIPKTNKVSKFLKKKAITNDFNSGKLKLLKKTDSMNSAVSAKTFPLVFASEGEKVKIISTRKANEFQERLISIGLNLGDEIEVMQNRERGAMLVARERVRYTLGGGIAHKILVSRI